MKPSMTRAKALAISALLSSACVHIEQSGDTTAATKSDSAAPATAATQADNVPKDSIAKENWVFAGVIADITTAIHDVARKHNFDLDSMPLGWPEPKYLANASARPDVGQYFTRYAAYAGEIDVRLDSIIDSVTTRRFRMAKFSAKDAQELRAGFDHGLAKTKAGHARDDRGDETAGRGRSASPRVSRAHRLARCAVAEGQHAAVRQARRVRPVCEVVGGDGFRERGGGASFRGGECENGLGAQIGRLSSHDSLASRGQQVR